MEKEGKIMSVENLNKFQKDLEEKEKLRKKFDEEMASEGVTSEKDYKSVVKIAQKLGYDITEEDFETAKSANVENMEKGELSDDELDKVAGGAWWQGPDAPDGHEVGCVMFYYLTWHEYYSKNIHCVNCGATANVELVYYGLEGSEDKEGWHCNNCGAYSGVKDGKCVVIKYN